MPTNASLPSKAVFHKWRDKDFPRGIYHHNFCLKRNANGSSSSWNEKTLFSSIKHENIKFTGKDKYIGKFKIL